MTILESNYFLYLISRDTPTSNNIPFGVMSRFIFFKWPTMNEKLTLTWPQVECFTWHDPRLNVLPGMTPGWMFYLTWPQVECFTWHDPRLNALPDMTPSWMFYMTWPQVECFTWHDPKLNVLPDMTPCWMFYLTWP